MKFRYTFILIILLFLSQQLQAQFTISTGLSPDSLARVLSGSGVTISNASLNCDNSGSGLFSNAPTALGVSNGVILTSGNATAAVGAPANLGPGGGPPDYQGSDATTQVGGPGFPTDPVLASTTTETIDDACVLEFDIKVLGDTLQFEYVFSSEEYNEFTCSIYDDVFGFFISGTNPAGGNYTNRNIALIPGTNTPVSVTNLNGGNSSGCSPSNQSFFNGPIAGIEYDGNTVKLTAIIATVPCEVYNMKLGVADAGDDTYDAAVFLQQGSFTSNVAAISAYSVESNQINYAVENCADGIFEFTLPNALLYDLVVNYSIEGSAQNGIDYQSIPDSVVIPAGSLSTQIDIIPVIDNLVEGTETIKIKVYPPCDTIPYDSATLDIYDEVPFYLSPTEDTICLGQTVQVNAAGAASYQWWPSTGISSTSSPNPIIFPSQIDTHFVAYTLGTCTDTSSVYVKVGLVNVSFNKQDVSCGASSNGSVIALGVSNVSDSAALSYQWNTNVNDTTNTLTSLTAGTYTVTVTDAIGCSKSASVTINQADSLIVAYSFDNLLCFGDSTVLTLENLANNQNYQIQIQDSIAILLDSFYSSNNQGEILLSPLPSNYYQIIVTDTIGNCADTINLTLNQPDSFQIQSSIQHIDCYGDSTGFISLTVIGGTPAYSYIWNTNETQDSITSLSAGTYSVLISDSNNCQDSLSFIITQPDSLTISVDSIKHVSCFGDSTGNAFVSINGGQSPYSFSWSNGQTTQNLSNAFSGTYCLEVIDANGCEDSICITILQNDSLDVVVVSDSSSCLFNDGSINITSISGGVSPYTVDWGNSIFGDTLNGLSPGNYSFTINDSLNCIYEDSVIVYGPPPLQVEKDSTNLSCANDSSGMAWVNVLSGAQPLTYLWSNGMNSDTISILQAGLYNVIVTDFNNCKDTLFYQIQQPDSLQTQSIQSTATLCHGDSTGNAFISVIGGTAPFTYQWNDYLSQTQDTATQLMAGMYQVSITDSNNCTLIDSVEVLNTDSLLITNLQSDSVLCYGDSTGSAYVTLTGGTAPYSFQWNDSNNTQNDTLLAVPSGQYQVTIQDSNNCQKTASVSIYEQTEIVLQMNIISHVSCNGLSDGSVYVEATGGVAPYSYEWLNTGITDDTLANIVAGTYTIVVTDNLGCEKTDSITITQPDSLIVNPTLISNVDCYGNASGTVYAIASGGTSPLTFFWNDVANTQNDTLENLVAGTYTIQVTDSNLCTTSDSISIQQPDSLLTQSIQATATLCYGDSSGSAFISVIGGTAPYTYQWNDYLSQTQDTATQLMAGMYQVSVSDSNNCTLIDSVEVLNTDSLLITNLQSDSVLCYGDSTGSAYVTLTGGTAPYSFQWNDLNNTQNDTLLAVSSGQYQVAIQDANNCQKTASVSVYEKTEIVLQTTVVSHVSCNGLSDGSVYVEATGGVAPYSYEWLNTGITDDTLTNVAAGTYTIVVTDNLGCEKTDSITITQPDSLMVNPLLISNVDCYGNASGTVYAIASGGTNPLTFFWNDVANTQNDTLENVVAGTYTIQVTDSNLCTTSDSISIQEPDSLYFSLLGFDSITCFGASDGVAYVQVAGGTPTYTFNWNQAGNDNDSLSNLSVGYNYIEVTDSNSCVIEDSIYVEQPNELVINIDSIQHVNCFGDSSGGIFISLNGGTPNYSYQWSNGTSFQDAINLIEGGYSVVVQDANMCNDSAFITVNENSPIQVTFGFDTTSCSYDDGRAYLDSIWGGVGPYTFNWIQPYSTNDTLENLEPGYYSLIVYDSLNCSHIDSAIVLPPALFTKDSMNVSCHNGNDAWAKVTPIYGTPPYTYTWSTGQTGIDSIGNLSAGQYQIIVTNSEGCIDSANFNIEEPLPLQVALTTDSVSCFAYSDGSIAASVIDGMPPYSYLWNDAANQTNDTATYLMAGLYSLTVTDANTCMIIDSISVYEPDSVIFTVDSLVDVACNGDSTGLLNISVSGGTLPYNYYWNDSAYLTQNLSNIPFGTYDLLLEDANLCTYNFDTLINQPDSLQATLLADSVSCYGGSDGFVYVQVNGGIGPYSFNWSINAPDNDTLFNVPELNYSVIVTDANACTQQDMISLFQPDSLQINFIQNNVSCFNGSNGWAKVVVTGGTAPYTYLWSNTASQDSIFNLSSNWYAVTITDANNCQIQDSVFITQPTELIVNSSGQDSVLCYGDTTGSAYIVVQGGIQPYSYLWNDNNAQTTDTALNLPAGEYVVTISDSNNCIINDTVQVFEYDSLYILEMISDTINCYGDSTGFAYPIVLGGNPDYTYLWNDVSAQTNDSLQNLPIGTYAVIVSDKNNCQVSDSVEIVQQDQLILQIQLINHVSCFSNSDGNLYTQVSGGIGPYSYEWDGNVSLTNDSLLNISSGLHWVKVTDALNCEIVDSFEILQPDSLQLSIQILQDISCNNVADGQLYASGLGGTLPYAFQWDDSNNSTNDTVSNISSDWYTVVLTDSNGCSIQDSILLIQPDSLQITTIQSDSVLCNGGNTGQAYVNLSGGTLPYSYLWNDVASQTTDTAFNLSQGWYLVEVTDSNNCSVIDSVLVEQPTPLIVSIDSSGDVLCHRGSSGYLYANAQGGTPSYSYLWNYNSEIDSFIENIPVGNYWISVVDANNCLTSDTMEILEPTPLQLQVIGDSTSCFNGNDGSAFVQVQGGISPYNYSWNDALQQSNDTAFNLSEGIYTVVVTDSNNCIDSSMIQINQPNPIQISLNFDSASCFGLNDGLAYVETIVGGTSPYTATWNTGVQNDSLINVNAGNYTVIVQDANACQTTDSIQVYEFDSLRIQIEANNLTCADYNDGSAYVIVTGGNPAYTYAWNNPPSNDSIINNLAEGNYSIIVTDANNCQSTATIEVGQPNPIDVFTETDSVSCWGGNDGSLTIYASGGTESGFEYSIDGGNTFYADSNFNNLESGIYTNVVVKDLGSPNGCLKEYQGVTTIYESPYFQGTYLPNDTTIILGEQYEPSLLLNSTYTITDIYQVNWSPDEGLSCANCIDPIVMPYQAYNEYEVEIQYYGANEKICNAYTTVIVKVENQENIYIPNAFTPSSYDQVNQFFEVYGKNIKLVNMKIFSRWGTKIYDETSSQPKWDGSFKGVLQQPGVYTYLIEITFLDDIKVLKKGSVTLIR